MKLFLPYQRGFSLLETLFVTVIMVSLAMMLISYTRTKTLNSHLEKTAQQMQQILQAASSYYIDKNQWPSCNTGNNNSDLTLNTCQLQTLVNTGYLQKNSSITVNPWGNIYQSAWSSITGRTFLLATDVVNPSVALALSGMLPLASVNGSVVTAVFNVPTYAYTTALSMKSIKTYGVGQAIPAPSCPANMVPKISVSPFVISGTINNPPSSSPITYVIQNFQAYFLGDAKDNTQPTKTLQKCPSFSQTDTCSSANGCWVACVNGVTYAGSMQNANTGSPPNAPWTYSSLQIVATTYCGSPQSGGFL